MRVINDNTAFLMAMGEGSRIEIHAADADKDSWTQITKTAEAGDTTLSLAEDTGWQVGDRIAIAATGYDMDEAEERTIVSVSGDGRTISLDAPLQHDHAGEIQRHDNGKTGAGFQSWDLDMRAEVALLSRNVTVQGDADSVEDGFGGHTMVMDGAAMHIDGAELTRMGQAGEVGRYPLHWHLLEDVSGQYVTNSSIHQTFNKGITLHGTQFAWLEDNAVYDTVGHSYYFEDGSEFGNVLTGNLGMNTKAAASVSAAAIGSDHTAVSTYWVTNPDNHLIDNTAAGSDHAGFWVLSQEEVEGASAALARYDGYEPRDQIAGQWVGNTSHSNGADGIFIGGEFNETNGARSDPALQQIFTLTDFTTYKNVEVAVWVRNSDVDLTDIKASDSQKGAQIWGTSVVTDSLFIGSLEDNPERPEGEYHGWELYDQASHFANVHFDGFSGPTDAAIAQGHGWGKSSENSAIGLTFGDDVPQDRIFQTKNAYSDPKGGRFNGDGTIAGTLHDLDGSISGSPGALVTPAIIPVSFNDKVDILNYAYDGIAASGFNASAGAVYVPEQVAWINPAGSVIGKVEYRNTGNRSDRDPFTIERTDNGAKILYGEDAQGQSSRGQFNVDGSGDVEYVIAYPEGLPDTIDMKFMGLPEGATALYRFEGLPGDVVFQGGTEVGSLSDLRAATQTAWTRDGGDLVVRIYADRFVGPETSRSDFASVEAESFQDEFKIVIAGRGTANPSGNVAPRPAPDDFWGEARTSEAPERAESTSRTALIGADDARWSDAGSWSGGVPGAADIVVIDAGQRIVLDADATVKGIIVNGGELLVEDARDIALVSDWVLVNAGGLFQVGTEDTPFEHDFDLTLEGDDPDTDVDVPAILAGTADNVVRATNAAPGTVPNPEPEPEPEPEPGPDPEPEPEPEPDPAQDPQPEPQQGPEPQPQPDPEVSPMPTTFTAVDSQSDQTISGALSDGAQLKAGNLSIVADPGMAAGSASFFLNGNLVRVENVAPYALFGDKEGDYADGTLPVGEHILEVVFHAGSGGSGAVLSRDTLSFSVAATPQTPVLPVDPPVTPVDPVDPVDPPNTDPTDPSGPPSGDRSPAPNSLAAWADQVVFHFDGNNNDEDDIAAIPVAALLAASAGIADKTTFLYGNNVSENTNTAQLARLEASAAFAETLGVDTMGYQPNPGPTTAELVNIMESGQKILMIEGGPMEAVYRALDQVDPAYHSNIRLLSHSSWNETRGQNGGRTWSDIAEDFPNVTQIDIRDQNWGQNNDQGFYNNAWNAWNGSDDPILSSARAAMNGATLRGNQTKNNDASDSGMLWFALTGQQDGTGQDAVVYIESSGLLDGTAAPDPVEAPDDDPVQTPDDGPVETPDDGLFSLALDHQSPLSEATYDPQTGVLDLLFNYDRLLDTNGAWANGRHIDALVIDGDVYPIIIHADDGPRDANGNYIFDETTVENTFSLNIGAGRSAADGTLDFALTDNENGTSVLYTFEMEADGVPQIEPPTDTAPGLIMAVNAGGGTFEAANGIVYEADTFGNGNSYSTTAEIAGTENDGLYQTERWQSGGFTYEIAVENGTYDVELNFAEIWAGAQAAGQRVFDIRVEDEFVFTDLDIASEVGFNAALDLIGAVEVTDGALTIETLAGVQNPKISGFSVWDSSGALSSDFAIGSITDDFALV